MTASAPCLVNDGAVTLIGATAARYAPGPETERTLEWTPCDTDR